MVRAGGAWEVFRVFLRLGLTSFGGPAAHIGYFRAELVERRRWIPARAFAELTTLVSVLPGPASSQLGFALGMQRAGWRGAMLAWLGFTAPSVALMLLFASGVHALGGAAWQGAIAGLMVAAVAVVAHAVLAMALGLERTAKAGVIAVVAAALTLTVSQPWVQPCAILAGVAAGACAKLVRPVAVAKRRRGDAVSGSAATPGWPLVTCRAGIWAEVACGTMLIALPAATAVTGNHAIALIDTVSRAGALVFGGGHAVLPLLEGGTVAAGWVTHEHFLAGYGFAGALPGPLFSFAAFLGASASSGVAGIALGIVATVAVFAPGCLLLVAALPAWGALRERPALQAGIAGGAAAVVGVLAATLVDPIIVTGIRSPLDLALAACGFVALQSSRVSPWVLVLACAAVGAIAELAVAR